jgi:hypothetical protein
MSDILTIIALALNALALFGGAVMLLGKLKMQADQMNANLKALMRSLDKISAKLDSHGERITRLEARTENK